VWGAFGMMICQFIVAIIGVTVGFNKITVINGVERANNIPAVNAQIAFIAIFIFFFATTWGPGAWVLIGEMYVFQCMRSALAHLPAASLSP
jgi:hypothetical protein